MEQFKADDIYSLTNEETKDLGMYLNARMQTFENEAEIDEFLKENNTEKDNSKRMIAYLFKLGIITNLSKAGDSIASIIQNYGASVKKLYQDSTEPLEVVKSAEQRTTIVADIKRSFYFFTKGCELLDILPESYNEKQGVSCRIIAMMTISDPERLLYLQGYDRWMFNMYALALKFMQTNVISVEYSEALAFELAKKLIVINDANKIIHNTVAYEPFHVIDRYIKRARKDIADAFKEEIGVDSYAVYFAIKWKLLFFSDEHNLKDTYLILDNFIFDVNKIEDLFIAAAEAHIDQVDINNRTSVLETIQRLTQYDITKIIDDTERHLSEPEPPEPQPEPEPEPKEREEVPKRISNGAIIGIAIGAAVGAFICYKLYQRSKNKNKKE